MQHAWGVLSYFQELSHHTLNLHVSSPLLVNADAFLHERVLIGIEQEIELPSRGHFDHEGFLQKLFSAAVAAYILYKPLHICPEVLHVCHSRRHRHFVEAEQSQCHPK